ncbi:MAG TPA: mechanosensitive ion channel [Spirochaetota bacterium]|nr:mechanosensitive ion channel [Spirochaetota bacterium]HQO38984.1 mechanosensitive ion channel [Spirochaetota bacterium]
MINEILTKWTAGIDWHTKMLVAADISLRLVVAIVISYITGRLAGSILNRIIRKTAEDDIIHFNRSIVKKNVMGRFARMLPFIILYIISEFIFADTGRFFTIFNRLLFCILIALGIHTLNGFLDALDDYYGEFKIARKNPIKGYLQLIKIFTGIAAIIVITATLFNMSPWGMLSGLGAMTALVVLMFRDWILGLIASIQINANNLVVIGDSIEMEKYGVNGEVTEISLSTVKVKNWDNTISMVPAYSLISETFKNWHGVKESGGRRIKRVIYIDMNSINLPDAKTVKGIASLAVLKKTGELKALQKSAQSGIIERINSSGITNIGIFRKYVELYMAGHPGINSERTLMAKLLEPTAQGVPVQLYAFTTIVDVVQFERELAEIVEHLIAVLPVFGLRLFQSPSGSDIREI